MTNEKAGLKAAAIFFVVLLLVAYYINVMGQRMNKTDAVITSADGSQAIVKDVTIISNDDQTIRVGDIMFGANTSYILQDDKVYVKTDMFDEVIESFIQKGYKVESYEDIHE